MLSRLNEKFEGKLTAKQPIEKSRQGRTTMTKLIEITIKELDRVGLANIDIDSVLRKAKISKGSLYHHFGSKNGLLAAAEAHQFITRLEDEGRLFRQLISACTSKSEFKDLIANVVKVSARTVEYRKKRIRAIAMASNDKNLAKTLADAQISVSEYLANSFQIAKDKGWIKPDVDMLAGAYWIQGVFIGHIMIDIADRPDLDEAWDEATIATINNFLTIN